MHPDGYHPACLLVRKFGDLELGELATDIKARGLLQPIVLIDSRLSAILEGQIVLIDQETSAVTPPQLPPMAADLRRRLTEEILRRGVIIPVIQAEDGEILDGKLRLQIAEEHDLFCPRIIVAKLSREERSDLRLCVNLYRRHLNRQQVRELIAWE